MTVCFHPPAEQTCSRIIFCANQLPNNMKLSHGSMRLGSYIAGLSTQPGNRRLQIYFYPDN